MMESVVQQPGHHVDVRVHDQLPCSRPVVHAYVDAVASRRLGDGNSDLLHSPHQLAQVRLWRVKDVVMVMLVHDKRMPGIHRPDVKEGECGAVLIDLLARNLACDDLAE
jgi:hypothetical protein